MASYMRITIPHIFLFPDLAPYNLLTLPSLKIQINICIYLCFLKQWRNKTWRCARRSPIHPPRYTLYLIKTWRCSVCKRSNAYYCIYPNKNVPCSKSSL